MSTEAIRRPPRGGLVIVELGSGWVKLARVDYQHKKPVVTHLVVEPCELSGGKAAEVLRAAAKKAGVAQGARVVSYLPRQAVSVRILELPSRDPRELVDMIDLQAGKQIPYSRDEVIFDYRMTPSDRDGYSRVMMVVAQRSVLRQRYYVIEDAGLQVARMSVSSEGLLNWARAARIGEGQAAGVLDVDAVDSDFTVIGDGGILFSRGIRLGAMAIRENVERTRDSLADEIRRGLEISRSETRVNVARIVLTGAGIHAVGLAEGLSKRLGLPVETVDSLKVLREFVPTPDVEGRLADVSLTVLIGAAVAAEDLQFHLVPDSVKARQDLVTRSKVLFRFAALFMAVLVAGSLFGVLKVSVRQQRLGILQQEVDRTDSQVREVERMRDVVRLVQKRTAARDVTLRVLAEIQRLTPDDVALDTIDIQAPEKALSIGGTALAMKDIRTLVGNLEQSALVKDAKEGSATSLDRSQRYRFQLVGRLEELK
jgi:Tfp pilus assembly PilM family ATPase/Tfp pilus assembly protein PilN